MKAKGGRGHLFKLKLVIRLLGLVARVWILVEVQQGPAIKSVNHVFCITIPGKHALSGFCCCIGLWVSDQLAWASINAQGIQGTGSLQHTISESNTISFKLSHEDLRQNVMTLRWDRGGAQVHDMVYWLGLCNRRESCEESYSHLRLRAPLVSQPFVCFLALRP